LICNDEISYLPEQIIFSYNSRKPKIKGKERKGKKVAERADKLRSASERQFTFYLFGCNKPMRFFCKLQIVLNWLNPIWSS
jgi:hypothetical protein